MGWKGGEGGGCVGRERGGEEGRCRGREEREESRPRTWGGGEQVGRRRGAGGKGDWGP